MSPVSRRTGRRYAAGSHTTLGDYPRVCSGCGKPVRVSATDGPANWFETVGGVKRSWHVPCRPYGGTRA